MVYLLVASRKGSLAITTSSHLPDSNDASVVPEDGFSLQKGSSKLDMGKFGHEPYFKNSVYDIH